MVEVKSEGKNPYRQGTTKHKLFQWALDKVEFTKEEFLIAAKQMREELNLPSKMVPDVWAKAWWNEFYNKHEVFADKN
jgi:hypothetical protein